jgi:hypothetical protein
MAAWSEKTFLPKSKQEQCKRYMPLLEEILHITGLYELSGLLQSSQI